MDFIKTLIFNVFVVIVQRTNAFFEFYIRESENRFVSFIWTTAVLFGWVKVIFSIKGIIEFIIRHVFWRIRWKKGGHIKKMYCTNQPLTKISRNKDKPGAGKDKCWVVISGASDGLGAEYAR
jgi:hypothetical protein